MLFVLFACFPATNSFIVPFRICRTSRKHRLFGLIHADFDFSSPRGWDEYYRQDDSNEILEWHSSVPFSVQVALVPRGSSCLVVGSGNSEFPRVLHDAHQGETLVTCLDSSSACLDQLRELHGDACPNMAYICGDAVQLSETLQQGETLPQQYNVIFDKGLTDAILCGEGWDGPLRRLLTEASSVLTNTGTYVLICYRLSDSRKEFLQEVGDEVGLSWSFDVDGTTDGVSVSTATKA